MLDAAVVFIVGSHGHRFAVAEDEGHVTVEGEDAVVSDVIVHHIPALRERCFFTREYGIVTAIVHLAVPVHIIDEMGSQGLAPNGIDLVLVEYAADDDIFTPVIFVI